MRIQWMKRRTAVALAAGTVALAAFGSSGSGLLAGLFDKDKCELPKRVPCGDCSFGYNRTVWQPWGTCDQTPSPQTFSGPVYVPGGGYSYGGGYAPVYEAPYSTSPAMPPDGAPLIIESPGAAPGSESYPAAPSDQTPILSEPAPARRLDSTTNERPFQQVPSGAPPTFVPDVRSIESPVPPGETSQITQPVVPQNPQHGQQLLTRPHESERPYRGPIEDPIRGLLPGTGYSPSRGAGSSVTDVPRNSAPVSEVPPQPAASASQIDPPPFVSPSRQSAPQSDYSEYIPLPTADTVPQSLALPNPADRARTRSELPAGRNATPVPQTPPQTATPPQQATPGQQPEPVIESFDPGTLPLPQSGTRPGAAPSTDAAGSQTGLTVPHDPYAGYRLLPTATDSQPQVQRPRPGFEELPSAGPVFEEDLVTRTSAERIGRRVQELTPRQPATVQEVRTASRTVSAQPANAPARTAGQQTFAAEPEYEVPDWKPLSDPAKTYRSATPQPARDWRTLQTPTGNRAAPANSEQQSRATRITAPPWQSGNTSANRNAARTSQLRQPTQYAPGVPPRGSAGTSNARALPSVEALLNGEPGFDSRPARVVQEMLYDVVEVDRRSSGYSVAVAGQRPQNQSGQSTAADSTGDWNPIWTEGGNQQSTAQSDRLTR